MKVCILIIYSDSEDYKKMIQIQKEYLDKFRNEIIFYFCQMNSEQTNDLEVVDNFLYVKGEEGLLNILNKTIVSMKYIIKNHNIDFLIRTNISTVININKFKQILQFIPTTEFYGSGNYLNLQWLSHENGIYDNSLFGTIYAQGTGIIFSKDVVEDICRDSDKLRYDIVDDLAIGVYINTLKPHVLESSQKISSGLLTMVDTKLINISQISDNYIFYRNRHLSYEANETRFNDIINMEYFTNNLFR
jgi:hypothetical protein